VGDERSDDLRNGAGVNVRSHVPPSPDPVVTLNPHFLHKARDITGELLTAARQPKRFQRTKLVGAEALQANDQALLTPVYDQVVDRNASRRAARQAVDLDELTGEINRRTFDTLRPLPVVLETDAKSASGSPSPELRRRSYALQDTAARLASGRITHCGRTRVGSVVEVRITPAGRSYYGGLQTCASVWACPICSSKVTGTRRDELQEALLYAKAGGLHVSMLTLTAPHGPRDDLYKLQRAHRAAYRGFTSGRSRLKDLLAPVGLVGTIRGQEVTHGQNGWHPHWHVLLFTGLPISDLAAAELFSSWQHEASRAGLGQVSTAALRLDRDTRLSGDELVNALGLYVVKWGAAEELTRSHVKLAGRGGRSPWQLLGEATDGDVQAGLLWAEYARVYKGQRQLVWSQGLRALFGLGEPLSDEEAAALEPDGWTVAAELTPTEWRLVRRLGLRAELLEVATSPNDAPLCYSHAFRAEQVVKEWLASLLRV
jgi:hypothetical protein